MSQRGQRLFLVVMLAPSAVVMLGVVAYPFVYNVVLSFSNMSLMHLRDWHLLGLTQYRRVFQEPGLADIFRKTLIWTFANVTLHTVLGVALALVLNQRLPGRALFRTILVLPWAIPQYIVALTWRGMFNYEYGAVNLILRHWFELSPVQWLQHPTLAFVACIATNVWLGFPFMMVIALGGLQSIPHELYEAAAIDGARWTHRLRHITLPLLRPVMAPAITLGIIWTFNNLNIVWLVSNAGEPSDKTHILVSYVYRAAFNFYRFGYAAALSMVIFGLLLAFSLVFQRASRAAEPAY